MVIPHSDHLINQARRYMIETLPLSQVAASEKPQNVIFPTRLYLTPPMKVAQSDYCPHVRKLN